MVTYVVDRAFPFSYMQSGRLLPTRHSVKMESAGRQSRHIDDGEQIVVPFPQILEKIAEVIQSIPQEPISERTIEKIVHFPMS